MNMISTGAFLNEMDASNKQPTVAEKFAAVWEKKNAKAARAGGVSLMALSLAACGSSSTTTTTSSTTTTTTTTATDAAKSLSFVKDVIDNLEGGSGDDTFTGDSNVTAADSATGGAGTDTVKLFGTTTLPQMSGIENVVLNGFTMVDLDFTPNELAGVTNITLDNFTVVAKTITLESGQSVDIEDATGINGSITIAGDTWTSGTIELRDSGSSTHAIDLDFSSAKTTAVTIKENGTDASSFVKVINAGAKVKTVNIDADYKLTVEDVAVATTINAADSSGALKVTSAVNKVAYTGGSGADTFTFSIADGTGRELTAKTGAGDDTVVISSVNNATDFTNDKSTIDGGAGDDTITMLAALAGELGALSAANYAKKGISNFEKLSFSDAAATTNVANFGVNHVILAADSSSAATLTGLTSGATLELGKDVDAVGGGANSATDLTITLADGAGSGDVLNLVIKDTTSAGTATTGLTINDVETLNVDASSATAAQNIELAAGSLTAITVKSATADVEVDLAATNATATAVSSVDATGMTSTGGLIFTATATSTTSVNVKGGAGGDTIVGAKGSDVIVAGAGDDTITTLGGSANTVDISSGGDDNVVIGVDGTGMESTTHTTITGFAKNDTISIGGTEGDDDETAYTVAQASQVDLTGINVHTIISAVNASTNSFLTTGSQTIADFTDMADVAAYIGEGFAVADDEDAVFILNNGTNSYIYTVTDPGDTSLAASEIWLTATVEGYVLAAADVAQIA